MWQMPFLSKEKEESVKNEIVLYPPPPYSGNAQRKRFFSIDVFPYPSNMPNSDPQEGFAVPDEDDGMPPPPDEGYWDFLIFEDF